METNTIQNTRSTDANLAEMGFPIGDPLQIEIGEDKYFPLIKAYKINSYLIIGLPTKDDNPISPEKDTIVKSALLLDGHLMTFESRVIEVYPEYGLLTMTHPENPSKKNLRRTKRVKTLLPVALITRGGKLHIPGTILDLSETGMLIGTDSIEGIIKGNTTRIALELPNITSSVIVNTTVRKIIRTSDKFLVGLSFDNLEKGVGRSIQHFCEQFTEFHYESEPILSLGQEINIEQGGIFETGPARGWAVGEKNRLYIEPPENSRLSNTMEIDSTVHIEFHNKGTSFSLTARFVSSLHEPNLWEFEANEKAKKEVERNDERYSCMLPVNIKDEENGQNVGKGMVIDLSVGGLKLLSKNLISQSEDGFLSIRFQFPMLRELKIIRIKIMRTQKIDNDYIYAGQFYAFEERDYATIEKYFAFCEGWVEIQQEKNLFK